VSAPTRFGQAGLSLRSTADVYGKPPETSPCASSGRRLLSADPFKPSAKSWPRLSPIEPRSVEAPIRPKQSRDIEVLLRIHFDIVDLRAHPRV
jgi:hypothetical protein